MYIPLYRASNLYTITSSLTLQFWFRITVFSVARLILTLACTAFLCASSRPELCTFATRLCTLTPLCPLRGRHSWKGIYIIWLSLCKTYSFCVFWLETYFRHMVCLNYSILLWCWSQCSHCHSDTVAAGTWYLLDRSGCTHSSFPTQTNWTLNGKMGGCNNKPCRVYHWDLDHSPPGQLSVLQSVYSACRPMQVFPPSQFLFLVRRPPPQVTVHSLQLVQSPHVASAVWARSRESTYRHDTLHDCSVLSCIPITTKM